METTEHGRGGAEKSKTSQVTAESGPGPFENYERFYERKSLEFLKSIPEEFWVPVLRRLYRHAAKTITKTGPQLAEKRFKAEWNLAIQRERDRFIQRFPKEERSNIKRINESKSF